MNNYATLLRPAQPHNNNTSLLHDQHLEQDDVLPLFSATIHDLSTLLQCISMINDPASVKRRGGQTTEDSLVSLMIQRTGIRMTYHVTQFFTATTTLRSELFTDYQINWESEQSMVDPNNGHNYGDQTLESQLEDDEVNIIINLPHFLRALHLFQPNDSRNSDGTTATNNHDSLRIFYQNRGSDLVLKHTTGNFTVNTHLKTFHLSQFISPYDVDDDPTTFDSESTTTAKRSGTKKQSHFEDDDDDDHNDNKKLSSRSSRTTLPRHNQQVLSPVVPSGSIDLSGRILTACEKEAVSKFQRQQAEFQHNLFQRQQAQNQIFMDGSVQHETTSYKLMMRCNTYVLCDMLGGFLNGLRSDFVTLNCLRWDSVLDPCNQPAFCPKVDLKSLTSTNNTTTTTSTTTTPPTSTKPLQNTYKNPHPAFIDGTETSSAPSSLLYFSSIIDNSLALRRSVGLPPPSVVFPATPDGKYAPSAMSGLKQYRCPESFLVLYRTDDFRRLLKGLSVVSRGPQHSSASNDVECRFDIGPDHLLTVKALIPIRNNGPGNLNIVEYSLFPHDDTFHDQLSEVYPNNGSLSQQQPDVLGSIEVINDGKLLQEKIVVGRNSLLESSMKYLRLSKAKQASISAQRSHHTTTNQAASKRTAKGDDNNAVKDNHNLHHRQQSKSNKNDHQRGYHNEDHDIDDIDNDDNKNHHDIIPPLHLKRKIAHPVLGDQTTTMGHKRTHHTAFVNLDNGDHKINNVKSIGAKATPIGGLESITPAQILSNRRGISSIGKLSAGGPRVPLATHSSRRNYNNKNRDNSDDDDDDDDETESD